MTGRRSSMRWLIRLSPLALVLAGLAALVVSLLPGAPQADVVAEPPAALRPAAREPVAPDPPAEHRREAAPATADRLRGLHLASSAPVGLQIPSIGVSTALSRLRLAADGTLEPPGSAGEVGWFTGSPTPGAVGPAVLAGHVTWNGTAAAFFDLARLRPGDRVLVQREDARTAVFTVTAVQRFPKAEFPTRRVYGPTDHAGLRLITCGGRFDTDSRRYDDNVVVFGRLLGVREGSSRS